VAFLLQHGQSPDDYVLATTAISKSQPAPRSAGWLAAAALDRLLLSLEEQERNSWSAFERKSLGPSNVRDYRGRPPD
jgi:hypothetical protein